MTIPESFPAAESTAGGGARPGRKTRRVSGGHGLAGPVSWTILGLVVGLTIFYGWRTASNREHLTQRNLRELDRIGRAIEGRIEGFAAGMMGWYIASTDSTTDATRFLSLVPGLQGRPAECQPEQPRAVASERRVRFCYGFPAGLRGVSRPQWRSGDLSLEPLNQALQTDLFDATLLSTDSVRVLVTRGPAGLRVPSGLRLHQVPPDTAGRTDPRASTVRNVIIAGREYLLFLQPLDISSPAWEPADSTRARQAPLQWSVGGLVSVARFRADSLALDPPHLIFLGLLLVLAVLSLPYLRAALMDRWESIKVADVYLLSLSAVLATGILGIALADIRHFGPFSKQVDRNLGLASERIANALYQEISLALGELDHWQPLPDSAANSRVGIWSGIPDTARLEPETVRDRYFRFQMLIWIRPDGMQADKLTPRETNTPSINVRDRAYFRRIKDQQWYLLTGGPSAAYPRPYYVESIRSKNTGEKLAVISGPYCWATGATDRPCPSDSLGVRSVTTRLASLDSALLPPGVRFAVVQRDGLTMFHSDPERNLVENFLTETDDDPDLHALLAGRDSGTVRTNYMGRSSRLHVTPLAGTDSLSLVLVLDESLPATAHFESIFLSLAVFLGWVIVVWAGFLAVELLLPRRLQWAWPDRDRPSKYPLLTGLMLGFGALLIAQAALAVAFGLPVEPASFLVPIQALSVALLVQSAGWPDRPTAWRDPRVIGWFALIAATLLQLTLQVRSPSAATYRSTLWSAQAAMVAVAVWLIRRFERGGKRAGPNAALEGWFRAAIVATLATTALLPAYLFHQEAVRRQRDRLVHYEQARLLQGLEEREHRIRRTNHELGLGAVFDDIFRADTLDVAGPPVLGARVTPGSTQGCREGRSGLDAGVFTRLERRMPFVTGAAIETRRLLAGAAGTRLESCRDGVLRLAFGAPGSRFAPDVSERFRQSSVPAAGDIGTWRLLVLLGVLAAGCGVLLALARWLGRRVFLLDVPDALPLDLMEQLQPEPAEPGKAAEAASLIAICNRSLDREPFRNKNRSIHYLDLLELDGADADIGGVLTRAPMNKLLVLDNFDHRLHDRSWSDRLLPALEGQARLRGRNLVLLTNREPRALFPVAEHAGGGPDETRERWIRLLGQFVDVEVAEAHAVAEAAAGVPQATGALFPGLPANLWLRIRNLVPIPAYPAARAAPASKAKAALDQECARHRGLGEIASRLEKRRDFERLTPVAVVEQVREMAESYYHSLWAQLEPDEKLVVSQLAHGVVVNPNGKRAVRRLLAREIVVRQPELRLMNESFRRFLQEEVPASFEEREHGEPSSAWQRIRFPIGLGLAVVAGFLFVTQRGAFDSAIALVTAAGVGSTALLKLISVIRLPGRSGE